MLLNNQHLGMVVQWEDRFYKVRGSGEVQKRGGGEGAGRGRGTASGKTLTREGSITCGARFRRGMP